MGLGDQIRNKAEEAGGQAKEKLGQATDNEKMEGAGEQQQREARTSQAGENVKDAARNITGGDKS